MRTKQTAVRRRKGFVSVYVAFSSFLLIPMAGLAIDFAVLYSVKAKLQTAVDAAAVGSGSTLNRGSVMDTAAVNDVALRFFTANYPAGYFGSTAVTYNSTPVQGALGVRTITVNASQHVPMLFMRVLGISQSTVAATAQVTAKCLRQYDRPSLHVTRNTGHPISVRQAAGSLTSRGPTR